MPRLRKMDENGDPATGDISVVDVYDIASDIGKECEKIIDHYGADAVTSLMPKVINALELLENLATKNERENTHLQELQSKIAQLENDKLEKAEYRQKFEKELEAIEDQWRTDTKELVEMVSKLQEDKRRLTKESPSHSSVSALSAGGGGGVEGGSTDVALLQRLKDSLEKNRDDLRFKDKLLQEKGTDNDNLRSQVDRLSSINRELRRKHKTAQSQVRQLCDERADFLVQLQDQQRDINALRQRLGLAEKENEDLVKSDQPITNKAVYDLDDPNRPRFTTQELKDILKERNELKARVSDLEDELETYRPKPKADTFLNLSPLIEACQSFVGAISPVEEDAPVQGPLPYEPDDAPWKKTTTESGIRKFFRKIFSENSPGGSFPRRSLSTLSKMALSSTTNTTDCV